MHTHGPVEWREGYGVFCMQSWGVRGGMCSAWTLQYQEHLIERVCQGEYRGVQNNICPWLSRHAHRQQARCVRLSTKRLTSLTSGNA